MADGDPGRSSELAKTSLQSPSKPPIQQGSPGKSPAQQPGPEKRNILQPGPAKPLAQQLGRAKPGPSPGAAKSWLTSPGPQFQLSALASKAPACRLEVLMSPGLQS